VSPRTTRHLVLLLIAVLWVAMVVHSLDYIGRFVFHYVFVSVRWLQTLFIVLSIYSTVLLVVGLRRPAPRPPTAARPFVSVLVPVKDEVAVIADTLRCLARLDYHRRGRRRFELIVVDDRSTDGTAELLERLRSRLGLRVVRTPPGSVGKAAALNAGLRVARGRLLAFFDADARVAPDFLQRMVACLDGPRVGGVQARRLPYNAGQNLLTRMQADEFGIFMTLFQRARERLRAFVAFAGNGLVLRRDALEAVGGWHEDALTEDIDLSVRFHLRGWQIRYCEEAVVWEEAVPTVRDLVRQRTRWFEGAMQALGEHLPAILFGRLPLQTRVDVLFFLAGSLVATLALLTTYAYGLLRLAGVVVLFLQVSPHLMAAASGLCSLSLLGAVVERLGWRPAQLVGVPLRFALFSLHRFVVVPYAIARYVRSAVTGRIDWAKTTHVGEVATERMAGAR